MLSALDGNPDNPQIVYALMQVEISAGEKDKAIAYLDQLIEMQPQNTELQAIRYSIANEDRIKAIEQFVASRNLSEGETAVTMLINLTGLARAEQRRSEQLDAAGNAEQAEAARELASRAETEAQRYLAQAEKLAPDNPRFQEHLFQTALIEEDWKAAEAVVERARTLDTDLAGGRLLAGQLDLARGNLQEAIIALNEAVQEIPALITGVAQPRDRVRAGGELRGGAHRLRAGLPEQSDGRGRRSPLHRAAAAQRRRDEGFTCRPQRPPPVAG